MTQIKMHGSKNTLTSSISTGLGVKLKSKLVLGCGWVGVWPVSRVVVVVVTSVRFVTSLKRKRKYQENAIVIFLG